MLERKQCSNRLLMSFWVPFILCFLCFLPTFFFFLDRVISLAVLFSNLQNIS